MAYETKTLKLYKIGLVLPSSEETIFVSVPDTNLLTKQLNSFDRTVAIRSIELLGVTNVLDYIEERKDATL